MFEILHEVEQLTDGEVEGCVKVTVGFVVCDLEVHIGIQRI